MDLADQLAGRAGRDAMKFVSTRGVDVDLTLSEAITRGIASDGGLYIPATRPFLSLDSFDAPASLPAIASTMVKPFAAGDPLEPSLDEICEDAFNFPATVVPLKSSSGQASVLELFHGPTCAFKDFGARFLAAALERLRAGAPRKLTVLVATSGDTGGAVAAAFHRRPWADVVLLYPKGLVSSRQAQQLSCWGDNVRTFAVAGTFDECQAMVKGAMRDPSLTATHEFSSANSINIGRLLPQTVYYAAASLQIWRAERRKPGFIVPSGNLGNVAACVLARDMGLPIGDIVLATNANLTVAEYLADGVWRPRPSVATLASAMDVGNPSNMERLRAGAAGVEQLRARVTACSVTDDEIRATIREDARARDRIWCPHSATAAYVYRDLARNRPDTHWIIVATAHPAKFDEIVEPLIGHSIPVPAALDRLLRLPRREEELDASLEALRSALAIAHP
jgi:threonine synthase